MAQREMSQWLQETDHRRNPSSVHRPGQLARADLEAARRRIAAALGAEPMEVTLCSGGTEADALAVLGVCRAQRAKAGRAGLLTSPLEHAAVLQSARRLAHDGVAVRFVDVDQVGRIRPEAVAAALARWPDIGVVSLSAANHELGNRYDIPSFVAAAREVSPDVVMHTDAVQAWGKVPVDFAGWGVDALSVSAHKIGGPAGVGALVHRRDLELSPLFGGGAQERGRRPGTEAAVLIQGFAAAAGGVPERLEAAPAVRSLRDRLRDGLLALSRPSREIEVLGDVDEHVGNTVLARFEGCRGELVMMNLDLEGIAVSTGSACSVGRVEPSPVVLALGHPATAANSVVRFSLGPENQAHEIERVLAVLPPVLERVHRASMTDGGTRA
ncbi:MAG: cysteine desulfurase [Myxococcales bacterium FL481]|nr:MAG: cysteine desulfurase [Myxococcales bacterium FL481]